MAETVVVAEQTCAVWYGGTQFRVERRAVPSPGRREVLLEVALSGVCGTDVHIVDGEFPIYEPPRVLGHEYAGTVRAVGHAVSNVQPGDRVAVDPSLQCGACFFCREGLPYMCMRRSPYIGGFGEYALVPEQSVYTLPPHVSFEAAALTEPLSCCLHAITLAGIRPGDRVAVVGAGAMGLMLLQLARRAGATHVIVSDPVPERREMATSLGADLVLDPARDDVVVAARSVTDGLGVDIALEAVGSAQTVADCIALPRRGGTAIIVGVAAPRTEVAIRPYDLFERELTIRGSFIRTYEFRRTVELLPFLQLEPLITASFPIERTPEAIENVRAHRGIKTVIRNSS